MLTQFNANFVTLVVDRVMLLEVVLAQDVLLENMYQVLLQANALVVHINV